MMENVDEKIRWVKIIKDMKTGWNILFKKNSNETTQELNAFIWEKRKEYKMEEDQRKWFLIRMMGMFGLLILFIFIIDVLKCFYNNVEILHTLKDTISPWFEGFKGSTLGETDMLFTQISVSFIVISLTSILSSTAMPIYWTDKMELSLVKPMFTSFAAFTAYTFGCLLFSTFCLFLKSSYVAVGFWVSIVVMAVLTYKMIDVYFGSSKAKKEASLYFGWLKDNCNNGQNNTAEEYEEAKQMMITVMSKNIAENDFGTFFENFDFLYKHELYDEVANVIIIAKEKNEMLFKRISDLFMIEKYDKKDNGIFNALTSIE